MKRAMIPLLVILGLVCCGGRTQGAIITIAIEGVVDDVRDRDNYLEGRINVGDLITGTYTYDTDTPDANPSSQVGEYEHFAYPCGFSLSVGGLNFKTDFSPGAPEYFTMWITNGSSGVDGISVKGYNNLPLPDGTSVNNIIWYLQDTSQSAISSIELPRTAPVLDDWDFNFLQLAAGGDVRADPQPGFGIAAHVTSAVVIPEPTTILLLGLGGLMFVRRAKK
jgi:hypothetical protein